MTSGINNNYMRYMATNTGIDKSSLQEGIEKSKQIVTDSVESNSVSQVVSDASKIDNMRDTVMLLPAVYFSNKLIDFAMESQGKKGLFNIVASLGDKISNVFKLDKLFNSQNGGRVANFVNNNRFTKYFTDSYKAVAKSSFAKNQTLLEKYANSAVGELKNLQEVIPDFGKYFNSKTLSHFGFAEAQDGVKTIFNSDMADDLAKGISKLVEENKDKISGSKLLGIKNKINAANMKTGKTILGQFFAKGTLKTKDLITYGGDLLGLYFAASAFSQAHKASKEAPKGEKLSTFMHVLSEQYIGLLLLQPCTSLLYKIGGNKYRGMTPAAREALKELVKNTNANTELTKEGLKIAKMQRNLLIKGVDKDKVAELTGKGLKEAQKLAKSLKHEGAKLKLWERPLKFMGRILDTGLDKMKITKFLNIGNLKIKLPKVTLGGFLGGFGRLMLVMMVLQPLLQKPVTKLFHKIFGEPKTYLEKQKKNEQKSAPDNNSGTMKAQQNVQAVNPQETNLLKIYSQNQAVTQQPEVSVPNNAAQPDLSSSAEETEIPALNLFKKDKTEEESYIPSIEVNFAPEDTSGDEARVDAMIRKTDKFLNKTVKMLNS